MGLKLNRTADVCLRHWNTPHIHVSTVTIMNGVNNKFIHMFRYIKHDSKFYIRSSAGIRGKSKINPEMQIITEWWLVYTCVQFVHWIFSTQIVLYWKNVFQFSPQIVRFSMHILYPLLYSKCGCGREHDIGTWKQIHLYQPPFENNQWNENFHSTWKTGILYIILVWRHWDCVFYVNCVEKFVFVWLLILKLYEWSNKYVIII